MTFGSSLSETLSSLSTYRERLLEHVSQKVVVLYLRPDMIIGIKDEEVFFFWFCSSSVSGETRCCRVLWLRRDAGGKKERGEKGGRVGVLRFGGAAVDASKINELGAGIGHSLGQPAA